MTLGTIRIKPDQHNAGSAWMENIQTHLGQVLVHLVLSERLQAVGHQLLLVHHVMLDHIQIQLVQRPVNSVHLVHLLTRMEVLR